MFNYLNLGVLIAFAVTMYLLAMGPAQHFIYSTYRYSRGDLSGMIYTSTYDKRKSSVPRVESSLYDPVLWACAQSESVYVAVDTYLKLWGSGIGHIAEGQSKGIVLIGCLDLPYAYNFGEASGSPARRSPPPKVQVSLFSETFVAVALPQWPVPEPEFPNPDNFHHSPWDTNWEKTRNDLQTRKKLVDEAVKLLLLPGRLAELDIIASRGNARIESSLELPPFGTSRLSPWDEPPITRPTLGGPSFQ